MRKCMSKLVIQPSFKAVGQKAVEWKTFENPQNKRQMYDSKTDWHTLRMNAKR